MAGTDDRFAFDAPTYHDFAAGDGGGAEGEADAFFDVERRSHPDVDDEYVRSDENRSLLRQFGDDVAARLVPKSPASPSASPGRAGAGDKASSTPPRAPEPLVSASKSPARSVGQGTPRRDAPAVKGDSPSSRAQPAPEPAAAPKAPSPVKLRPGTTRARRVLRPQASAETDEPTSPAARAARALGVSSSAVGGGGPTATVRAHSAPPADGAPTSAPAPAPASQMAMRPVSRIRTGRRPKTEKKEEGEEEGGKKKVEVGTSDGLAATATDGAAGRQRQTSTRGVSLRGAQRVVVEEKKLAQKALSRVADAAVDTAVRTRIQMRLRQTGAGAGAAEAGASEASSQPSSGDTSPARGTQPKPARAIVKPPPVPVLASRGPSATTTAAPFKFATDARAAAQQAQHQQTLSTTAVEPFVAFAESMAKLKLRQVSPVHHSSHQSHHRTSAAPSTAGTAPSTAPPSTTAGAEASAGGGVGESETGAGGVTAAVAAAVGPTVPRAPHLATDERANLWRERELQLEAQQKAKEEEERKAREFHARPMPKFDAPASRPAVAHKAVTVAKSPVLQTRSRAHEHAVHQSVAPASAPTSTAAPTSTSVPPHHHQHQPTTTATTATTTTTAAAVPTTTSPLAASKVASRQPGATAGAGAAVAAAPPAAPAAPVRAGGPTVPVPFALKTDARGEVSAAEARRRREEAEEREKHRFVFKARAVGEGISDVLAVAPSVGVVAPVRPPTVPRPFELQSDKRHQVSEAAAAAQRKAAEEKAAAEEAKHKFHARKVPASLHRPAFAPEPSQKLPTAPVLTTADLHSERRAAARARFDEYRRQKAAAAEAEHPAEDGVDGDKEPTTTTAATTTATTAPAAPAAAPKTTAPKTTRSKLAAVAPTDDAAAPSQKAAAPPKAVAPKTAAPKAVRSKVAAVAAPAPAPTP